MEERHSKVKHKGDCDIMVFEDMNMEVKFSSQLPQPNNLNRKDGAAELRFQPYKRKVDVRVEEITVMSPSKQSIWEQGDTCGYGLNTGNLHELAGPLERWLQLMLRWNSKERGTDPVHGPNGCFKALDDILNRKYVQILDMKSGLLHSYPVSPEASVQALQQWIKAMTGIEEFDQELLLETGTALDPRKPVSQCAPDCRQNEGKKSELAIIYLFDRSTSNYDGQVTVPKHPDAVNFILQNPKQMLPYHQLRRSWGQSWHVIRSLKENCIRLQQGQRAAMMSLLRYNSNLSKLKTTMLSRCQQLKAKLDFFRVSIQIDLEKYSEQMEFGIKKMITAWKEMQLKAEGCRRMDDVTTLDELSMALQTDLVDLQRSPLARQRGEALEA
eukprot:g48322.t1